LWSNVLLHSFSPRVELFDMLGPYGMVWYGMVCWHTEYGTDCTVCTDSHILLTSPYHTNENRAHHLLLKKGPFLIIINSNHWYGYC
jgi:hypothetical protein